MSFRSWNEFWNSNFMEASFFGSCHWSLDLFAPSSDKVSETSINERNLKFSRFGIVFFQKEIRIFEEPPGVPEIEQLYSARTWRPHHSTKHPQNEGTPPFPPPIKPKVRRMEMGMGGAVNGIINSILTNNDNLSICGLLFMKRTSQKALVLPVNHRANDCPT